MKTIALEEYTFKVEAEETKYFKKVTPLGDKIIVKPMPKYGSGGIIKAVSNEVYAKGIVVRSNEKNVPEGSVVQWSNSSFSEQIAIESLGNVDKYTKGRFIVIRTEQLAFIDNNKV